MRRGRGEEGTGARRQRGGAREGGRIGVGGRVYLSCVMRSSICRSVSDTCVTSCCGSIGPACPCSAARHTPDRKAGTQARLSGKMGHQCEDTAGITGHELIS